MRVCLGFKYQSKMLLKIFMLLCLWGCCATQKPNTDSRRHDVYIAGFFPFGRGVENADTGKDIKLFFFCIMGGVSCSLKSPHMDKRTTKEIQAVKTCTCYLMG